MEADASLPDGLTMTRNRIVEENRLPGAPSTEWDVNGWGDPSIQGFGHDISIDLGETIFFKVKTDSTDYRIDIYRMGWYEGLGARPRRHRRAVGAAPASTAGRPPRSRDAPLRLRELGRVRILDRAGRRGLGDLLRAPRSPGSGAGADSLARRPFAHSARRPPRGGSPTPTAPSATGGSGSPFASRARAHIYFVVRDDASRSDILFQDRRHHLAGLQPLRRARYLLPPRSRPPAPARGGRPGPTR